MGSEFIERITLDLDGTAVDGTGSKGLQKTSDYAKLLLKDLMNLTGIQESEKAILKMAAGATVLTSAFLAVGVAAGSALGTVFAETIKAGEQVDGYTKSIASAYGTTDTWAGSMDRASRVIPELQKGAILTGASVGEMVKVFRDFSLLTQGSNADILRVTNSLAVMAKAADISVEQLSRVISQAAITGALPQRGEAGPELLLGLGLTGEAIKNAQDSGRLLDLLTEKIGDQSEKARTLASDWSSLGSSFSKISTSLKAETAIAWDPLVPLFKDIRDVGMSDEFRDMARSLGEVGREIVASKVRDWVVEWVAFKEGVVKPLLNDLAPMMALLDMIGLIKAPTPQMVPLASSHQTFPGTDTMTQLPLDAIKKGREEWEKLVDSLNRDRNLAGLTGIDRQLAEINEKERSATAEVEKKWTSGFLDASAKVQALAVVQETASRNRRAALDAEASKQEKVQEGFESFAASLQAKLDVGGLTGISRELAEVQAKTAGMEAQIDHWSQKGATGIESLREKVRQFADVEMERFILKAQEATSKSINLFNVEALRANGDDFAAALEQESGRVSAELSKWADQWTQVLLDPFGDPRLKELAFAHLTAIGNASSAVTAKIVRDSDVATAGMTHNWSAYWDEQERRIRKGEETWSEGLANMASEQKRWAVTAEDGVVAASNEIASKVQTVGQATADYLTSLYDAVKGGIEKGINALLTGTGDIKSVLKGILDDISKSFSHLITQLIEEALPGQKQIAQGGGSSASGFTGLVGSLFGGKATTVGSGAGVESVYGPGTTQYGDYVNGGGPPAGGAVGLGQYAGWAGVVGGVGMGIAGAFHKNQQAVSYQGADLGVKDFGGDSFGQKIGPWVTAAVAALAVPVLGWIGAAVILVVGAIVSLFNGPKEGHVQISIREALTGSGGALGNFVNDVIDGTANFIGDLATKAAQPGKAKDFIAAYQKGFQEAYGNAAFDIAAGSADDLQKDVQNFFKQVLPKMALQSAFGQIGYGPNGNRDAQGGVGGLDWNMNSPAMDKDGNWIQKQLFDPNAPIPMMLAGLGFTGDKVKEISQKLADSSDIEAFKKWLGDLVGLVAQVQSLTAEFSKSYADVVAEADATNAAAPAAAFGKRAADMKDLFASVALYTGDEQIQKGQEAAPAAQQFLADAKAAMLQLAALAKQISQDYIDAVKQVDDALKSPANLAAESVASLEADYQRMRFAANPADLSDAWAKAKADFASVANEIVGRIQSIKGVLSDIGALQALMSAGPGPDAQTDPQAWLAQNMAAMEKYRAAMTAATPGSPEQIAAETTYAGLIRDRYQMGLDFLGRVKSAITSINQSIDEQLFNITLGEKTGNDKSQFLYGRLNDLYGQLQTASTPEQVQALVSQIQSLSTTLLSYVGQNDPNRATAVDFVKELLERVRAAANTNLGTQQTSAQIDIATLGPKLAAAETAMAEALTAAQQELTDLEWHFKRASEFAAQKLEEWGVAIATEVNKLVPELEALSKNFTDVNAALGGVAGGTGKGTGRGGDGTGDKDLPGRIDDFGSGLDAVTLKLIAFGDSLPSGSSGRQANASATSGPGAQNGISVTANVTVQQNGSVDLDKIWEALEPSLVQAFQSNNRSVVRRLQGQGA